LKISDYDFKKKSFKFENIYNVTCDNSYVTLKMIFQIYLLFEIKNNLKSIVKLIDEILLFGIDKNINDVLMIF